MYIKNLMKFPLIISGVGYDGLFRGHLGVATQFSPGLANTFKSGVIDGNYEMYQNMLKSDFNEFKNVISDNYSLIQNKFGDFKSTETHLLYSAYISSTRYFQGEWKIADSYTNIRMPAYDNHLIELAFSIQESTLSFSQLSRHKRLSRNEMVLQAYILSKLAPQFANIQIGTIGFTKPNIVLTGDLTFEMYTLYRKILNKISKFTTRAKPIPPEDWNNWLNVKHRKFVDGLIFSKDSLINNYFSSNYLLNEKASREIKSLGRLLTIEIILRLVENGWKKFW